MSIHAEESKIESFKAALAFIACAIVVVTAPTWGPIIDELASDAEQPPEPLPTFAELMKCPEWKPGFSRTLTVIATEDEAGAVTEFACIRAQERGKARVM